MNELIFEKYDLLKIYFAGILVKSHNCDILQSCATK